ncbi:helix-turn-helix transcriptional regulator [Nonomuraea wenchangensis]|uniref:helix-turn-helix transcriptional regulator n=1 Tax=Nonomuraea wenchangensis TaxID=568860 RepID=UPI00331C0BE1
MSDNAPAKPFLDLVEATLAEMGRTKTWLSQRSNVSRATINNWAHQPRTPQSASVIAVAEALGIDQRRALRLAGLPSTGSAPETEAPDLSSMPLPALAERLHHLSEELDRVAAELARRPSV